MDNSRIIRDITAGIAPKTFPEGFIGTDYEGDTSRIPSGLEVSMYRELEGVFIMIDGQRLFFNQPAFAKFVFYCAKAGITEVRVPDAKLAKKATKGLEEEISNITFELKKRLKETNLGEKWERELLEEALEYLGIGYYSDIVSEEDLW